MRKITEKSIYNFLNDIDFKQNNTEVRYGNLYLFGNKIASKIDWKIYIYDGGWQTITTKERLNWILYHFGMRIFQKNYEWFISKWDKTTLFKNGIIINQI